MHLPFIQVTNEAVDLVAAEVAVCLDADEMAILGGLVHLYRWALQRCPDHLPPSASDVVTGPHAAKLIARAAGYRGDPEAFVTACTETSMPALERVEGGIRIRGLDRYDSAWAKNHQDLWKLWKQQGTPEPEAKPELNRRETGAKPVPHTQTHIQTQKEEEPPPTSSETIEPFSPPSPEVAEQELRGDGDGNFPLTPLGFCGFWNHERRQRGLTTELLNIANIAQFAHEAIVEAGQRELFFAAIAYFDDEHFRAKGWTIAVFMKPGVWRPRAQAPPRKQVRL